MDLATVIGLVLGVVLVLSAIVLGGSPLTFINVPSALIVVGGTIASTMIQNPMAQVIGTIGVVKNAFSTRIHSPKDLIAQVVELSRKARKESLLALEKVEIDYDFLSKGVHLCVDGLEPAQIRSILETEIDAVESRHRRGQEILDNIALSAPAFGMIGTLVGLVSMLANMNDPKTIGPSMAVAILTTLYGSAIANMFASPLSSKLKVRTKEEVLNMTVCLEGVLGIVQGDHPASIDEKLKAFLSPKDRAAAAAAEKDKKAA